MKLSDLKFFSIHAAPGRLSGWILTFLPFILAIGVYTWASHQRRLENSQDKILPSIGQMTEAFNRMAFEEDPRSEEFLFWEDTKSSLMRLGVGVSLAASFGFLIGLYMGLYPAIRGLMLGFMTFISIVPPLAILPILFISFGVEELGKIMLIFLGTFPVITRDMYLATRKLPKEQVTKALTLGASEFQLVYRVVVAQIFPRLLETIRLTLGSAWLFLIGAEAIASTTGLGYRIFLVRRYLAMDVILPYVLWITLLGYSFDTLLRIWVSKGFKWYTAGKT